MNNPKPHTSLCFALATLVAAVLTACGKEQTAADTHPVKLLWIQYGLANETLKLAAHTDSDPLNPTATMASLQLKSNGSWETIIDVKVDPLTAVAEFRVEDWDSTKSHAYRVVCGSSQIEGTVRADPVDKSTLKLMAVSCVNDNKFPYREAVRQMIAQDPDLVFFAGDQLYQTNAGRMTLHAHTEADVLPAMANYLPKWRKFGLTFRDLLKDRPSIIITDDHDVYVADLWGNGGRRMDVSGQPGEVYDFTDAEARTRATAGRTGGGYLHPEWTNAVERAQMWHLPDAARPGPWGDGIMAYFTSLEYGGVSFAILEDRKFKSPPTDALATPVDDPRTDEPNTLLEVIMDPSFDTKTLDRPGLNLLGEAQEKFVHQWAEEVAKTNRLAAVLHQSPLANVGNYEPQFGDMDSNGWPQTARDDALRAIAPSDAVMISGDIHYATIHQHGIDEWGDGPWSYSLPAFGSSQGRTWDPQSPPQGGAIPGMEGSGNYNDRFGNKLTMVAKADGIVGYGTVLFDKDAREITFQIHPMNPLTREPIDVDVPGWPKKIHVE